MGDGGCKFVLGRQRLENYHYNMDPFIFHPFFIYIQSFFKKKK